MADDSQVLGIRLSTSDLERLRAEADRIRLPLSAYARMVLLEGHNRRILGSPVIQPLIDALESDRELRLKLRRLITNPREG